MQKISGPVASRPQVIPMVAFVRCSSDGGSGAQKYPPHAYVLGTSLSLPSANLPLETSILYEPYVLDYLVASRGVQWYMQIGD